MCSPIDTEAKRASPHGRLPTLAHDLESHQFIERAVRHLPLWVKIGFKQDIIKALRTWRGQQDWESRINWTEWIGP